MMMKKTDKTLFLVLRLLKATPFVVFVFYFFLWSGLFFAGFLLCFFVPGTLAGHLLYTWYLV